MSIACLQVKLDLRLETATCYMWEHAQMVWPRNGSAKLYVE